MMLDVRVRLARCCSHAGVLVVVAALVLVPTVMRARQRVERRETTRLSIRLNWQSEAPPRIIDVAPDKASSDTGVLSTLAQPPRVRAAAPAHAFDEPVAQPISGDPPDPLRGPPTPIA